MTSSLVPCPGCTRHVRTTESACPFCGVAFGDLEANAIPGTTQRLSRAAAFAFTASLAVTGCSSSSTTPSPAPANDAATAGDAASDAPEDTGSAMALYGAPVIDAGSPDDAGGLVAAYGAPAPVDGG